MQSKVSILLILSLLSSNLNAQKASSNWAFGKYAWMEITPTSETFHNGSLMDAYREGVTSYSDDNGNLLYYSDGQKAWRVNSGNHSLMPNGTGLLGSPSSTHSGLIVPHPTNTDILYLFTVDYINGNNGMRVSTINKSLDAGLGDIVVAPSSSVETIKNQLLIQNSAEKIAAYRKKCSDSTWVVGYDIVLKQYKAFLITANGINLSTVISSSNANLTFNKFGHHGQMKFSPDGNKLGTCFLWPTVNGPGIIELCEFDFTTGMFTNPILINSFGTSQQTYGLEFSPNSNIIYYSTLGITDAGVYQVDLATMNQIQLFQTPVVNSFGLPSHRIGSFQLASNGHIYIAADTISNTGQYAETHSLSTINNPNQLGLGCNFIYQNIPLPNGTGAYLGLPTFLQYSPTLEPQLYEDTIICQGQQLTLNPNLTGYQYLWSTGETSDTITVNSTGDYFITVSHSTGCKGYADIHVEVSDPQVDLGPNLSLCQQNPQVIDAGPNYDTYLWSNGGTNQTVNIAQIDTLSVVVTDTNGCNSIDEVIISNDTVIPIISGPSQYCKGTSVVLDAGAGHISYLWSNNNSTQTTNASQGTYWVEVTDINGCKGSDTLSVVEHSVIPVNITGDTTYCEGSNVILNAGVGYQLYKWSDGSNDQFFIAQVGMHIVEVVSSEGCSSRDTVFVYEYPKPSPNIEGKLYHCPEQNTSVTLDDYYKLYQWTHGPTTHQLALEKGKYSVFVVDTNDCVANIDITIEEKPNPRPEILTKSTVCLGKNNPATTKYSYSQYLWNNQFIESSVVLGKGMNWVEVKNEFGCIGTDTIELSEINCFDSCAIYIPNAFTPNSDGLNDLLAPNVVKGDGINDSFSPKILTSCNYEEYMFSVYNRWGDLLFQTDQINQGWNGSYNSKRCELGVYIWELKYKRIGERSVTEFGHASLIN